jgi:hypothetical protein
MRVEIANERRQPVVSLDGVYDCRANRKAIFNRGMIPNIPENPRGRKTSKRIPQTALRSSHFRGALQDH